MANNSNSAIRKNSERIIQQKKDLEKASLVNQCNCQHIHPNSKDFNAVQSKNYTRENPLYTCKECHKDISIRMRDRASLEKSVDNVDYMCDVIKISINPENEADAKLLKQIQKHQYRNTQILKIYDAAMKAKGKGKNRNRGNNNNNQNSGWGKPVVG